MMQAPGPGLSPSAVSSYLTCFPAPGSAHAWQSRLPLTDPLDAPAALQPAATAVLSEFFWSDLKWSASNSEISATVAQLRPSRAAQMILHVFQGGQLAHQAGRPGQLLQNHVDNGLSIAPFGSLPAFAASSLSLQTLAFAAEPAC